MDTPEARAKVNIFQNCDITKKHGIDYLFVIQLKNVYKTFWIMAHTIQAHFCLLLINFIYFLLFLMFRTSYGIACFGSL